MFTIQFDTQSGSTYVVEYAGQGSEWGTCTANTESPWVNEPVFEVRMDEVLATEVGKPLRCETRMPSGIEGPLTTSPVERILHVLAYAETNRGDMLPMVTNRCDCGAIVNLAEGWDTRTWGPLRVMGNSANGYEPYCGECRAKGEAEMAAMMPELEAAGIKVVSTTEELLAALDEQHEADMQAVANRHLRVVEVTE